MHSNCRRLFKWRCSCSHATEHQNVAQHRHAFWGKDAPQSFRFLLKYATTVTFRISSATCNSSQAVSSCPNDPCVIQRRRTHTQTTSLVPFSLYWPHLLQFSRPRADWSGFRIHFRRLISPPCWNRWEPSIQQVVLNDDHVTQRISRSTARVVVLSSMLVVAFRIYILRRCDPLCCSYVVLRERCCFLV